MNYVTRFLLACLFLTVPLNTSFAAPKGNLKPRVEKLETQVEAIIQALAVINHDLAIIIQRLNVISQGVIVIDQRLDELEATLPTGTEEFPDLTDAQRQRTILPASFIDIEPGTDIQGVVDAHPAGTAYRLKAGIYRNQSVAPKPGDTFAGEVGTILNGSTLLTDWTVDGGLWRQDGINAPLATLGWPCRAGFICNPREDIYFNDDPLRRVATVDDVVSGTFATATDPDVVWIADDPTAQMVEIGTTGQAFGGSQIEDVTIRNLTVEKYATKVQKGAIHHSGSWLILNVTARLNHGSGMAGSGNDLILNSIFNDNGQIGITLNSGNGGIVWGNEIARNNYAGVEPEWEAGGTKFVKTIGLIVRNNCVHDNEGHGLWVDIDNIGTLIEGNIVFGNDRDGIKYEISYDGIIRANYVFGNGADYTGNEWNLNGAQIRSQNSPRTIIEDNIIVVFPGAGNGIAWTQSIRGSGVLGEYNIRDNQQINNDITFLGFSGQSGAFINKDLTGFLGGNNVIDGNDYTVPDGDTAHFMWGPNVKKTWSQFLADGNEVSGTLTVSQETAPVMSCDG